MNNCIHNYLYLLPESTATTSIFPLVGREKELAQIVQSWRTVLAGGEPHLVLLRGEAGIGKTRLIEELLQWASRQGFVNANTRCYAAEGDLAYAPAIDWVRAHSLEHFGRCVAL